jgi:hypothetical protein
MLHYVPTQEMCSVSHNTTCVAKRSSLPRTGPTWLGLIPVVRNAIFREKATISLVISVCTLVHVLGTIWLPLDGFSRNLKLQYFSKICTEHYSSFIYIFNNSSTKIAPFMLWEKIWKSHINHRWQNGICAMHAGCYKYSEYAVIIAFHTKSNNQLLALVSFVFRDKILKHIHTY